MPLIDPKYPPRVRYSILLIFVLFLLAVFALGAVSISRSISDLTRVGENVAELKYQVQEEISVRSQTAEVEDERF